MKKFMAVLLALALSISLCAVFASAEGEVDIAGITFASADEGVVTTAPQGGGDLNVLIDGDVLEGASAFGTKGIVLFCNTHCKNAGEYPTFSLTLELSKAEKISGATVSLYEEFNAMIGTPAGQTVAISTSTDGSDFAFLGDFALGCRDGNAQYTGGTATGDVTPMVETAEIDFGKTVDAKYVQFTFEYGDSPFTTDGKIIWEWLGLTELSVKSGSGTIIDDPSEDPSEAPSEAPSEVPSEDEPIAPPTTATNIAPNATVVGGEPSYDSYNGKVTDGIIGDYAANTGWAAFYYLNDAPDKTNHSDPNVGEIVLDFGEKKDFSSFRTHVYGTGRWGISGLSKVEFSVSDDGENWTSVGAVTDGLTGEGVWVELEKAASGRYVKYTYTKDEAGGVFLFVSECEAYAAAQGGQDTPTSKPVTPVTADGGIVALAVITVLAAAGALVVKKVR